MGTEAFLVAVYQNCYEKWQYIGQYKKNGGKDPDRKHEKMKTLFIATDAGQARWGGWNKEGRNFVKQMAKKIAAARKEPHVTAVEEACLQRIHAEHDIVARDQKRKDRSGRKRKAVEEDESEDEFDQL